MLIRRAGHLQLLVEECAMHCLGSTLTESVDVSSGAFIGSVGALEAVGRLVYKPAASARARGKSAG